MHWHACALCTQRAPRQQPLPCARAPLPRIAASPQQPHVGLHACRKNAALYAAYVVVIAAALAVALGAALSCPALASGSLGLLLSMVVLAWAAVSASTVGLQVGSNG